jgi:hypothetical protein
LHSPHTRKYICIILEPYLHLIGEEALTLLDVGLSCSQIRGCAKLDTSCLNLNVFRYYINYKLMKKKVKHYGQQLQQGEKDRRRVLKDFSKMLDDQVILRSRYLCEIFKSIFPNLL